MAVAQVAAPTHTDMANALRFLSVDAVEAAKSGHPGMPMGLADVATVLFSRYISLNPADPTWINRDRFVLSNGHGSMLLYSLLHLMGYDLSIDDIRNFRQLGSKTPGHPEYGHTPGVETTTGPLGQGFANAVGMAFAQKHLEARWGKEVFNNRTYVMVGDGCLMEGISHEAAELAGHLKLNQLTVLFDDNAISIDGPTSLATSTDILKRFDSYGFATTRCDGHNPADIARALDWALRQDKPSFIACKTQIGYGSSLANTGKVHGSPLGEAEAAKARANLGWAHGPFHVPADVRAAWADAAKHAARHYTRWQGMWAKLDAVTRTQILNEQAGQVPAEAARALLAVKKAAAADRPALATRQASGNCLDVLAPVVPALMSGSADLTGSNNTKAKEFDSVSATNLGGRYLHYGVREHAMGALMNGMALYGGIIPLSGTFLAFADYMRAAIRLSALMNQRVVYVMTHDSIGLGEDGPTHQPIEHAAMLRATPNVRVFRPADLVETAEAWQLALEHKTGPSVLCLSRQAVPTVRYTHTDDNLSAKGGYVLADTDGPPQGLLLATGTEVHLALEARNLLAKDGIKVRVVSLPCTNLFDAQPQSYKDEVLPPAITARVAIEAASPFGWDRYLGTRGKMLGLNGFGASAPAKDLYKHFGLTAENLAQTLKTLL